MGSNVARFPVERVMSTRVAEEAIGGMVQYKYPDGGKFSMSPDEWIAKWMKAKFVLLGWETVKKGVVAVFKSGRCRHLVRRTYSDHDGGRRPHVQAMCSTIRHPIWNWSTRSDPAKRIPAVVLSDEQAVYFPLCKRCEAMIKKAARK